jgi:hypothetical protein
VNIAALPAPEIQEHGYRRQCYPKTSKPPAILVIEGISQGHGLRSSGDTQEHQHHRGDTATDGCQARKEAKEKAVADLPVSATCDLGVRQRLTCCLVPVVSIPLAIFRAFYIGSRLSDFSTDNIAKTVTNVPLPRCCHTIFSNWMRQSSNRCETAERGTPIRTPKVQGTDQA